MGSAFRYLIPIFLLFVFLQEGLAVECFQCAEEKGGDGICRNDKGVKHATVDCSHSCITHSLQPFSVGGLKTGELVIRLCSDPSYCLLGTSLVDDSMGLKTAKCTSCNTNYCNSVSTVVPSFILIAVLSVKSYFF